MGRHKASRVVVIRQAGSWPVKIFINYRRDDSAATAGRLHDRLAQTFGRENLFMDVDHIPAGVDFVDYLPSQVAACDVFLAVIGPNWLDAKDDDGRRRFENPDDFVAIEIAAALARNIRVIPVLIDGARTPKADKLPDSIKPLVRRNAVEVRHANFGRDAESVITKVREALKTARPVTRRWPFTTSVAERLWARRMVAGGAAALLLVGWIGYQMGVPVWVPSMQRMQRAEQPLLKAPSAVEEAKQQATPPLSARVPAVVALTDAEAKRKAHEAEQQRLTAAKAEEERKAKAAAEAESKQAEKERLAAAKTEEERKATAAAEAEAKRKSEEAERQRQAAALVSQSSTALNNGDNDKAIATASEALRLNPDDAVALTNRGVAYARKGDPDRAIADYSEAIRLSPNFARAFYNRGSVKLRISDASGDADKAKARELHYSCP